MDLKSINMETDVVWRLMMAAERCWSGGGAEAVIGLIQAAKEFANDGENRFRADPGGPWRDDMFASLFVALAKEAVRFAVMGKRLRPDEAVKDDGAARFHAAARTFGAPDLTDILLIEAEDVMVKSGLRELVMRARAT